MRNVSSVEKEGYEGIHLKFYFRIHVAPVPRFQCAVLLRLRGEIRIGWDGLHPLSVCTDNALAAAVEAGGVAELAAAVASGANFDSISLSACGVVVGRRGSIRGWQTCMGCRGTEESGYQSHEGDAKCFHWWRAFGWEVKWGMKQAEHAVSCSFEPDAASLLIPMTSSRRTCRRERLREAIRFRRYNLASSLSFSISSVISHCIFAIWIFFISIHPILSNSIIAIMEE